MPDKPWGPEGEGQWVEIPNLTARKIQYPAWVTAHLEAIPRWAEVVPYGRINLLHYDGVIITESYDYLDGEYVWVPAPEQKPKPESPDTRPGWIPEGWEWLAHCAVRRFYVDGVRHRVRIWDDGEGAYTVEVRCGYDFAIEEYAAIRVAFPMPSREAAFAAAEALACGRWEKEDGNA